MIKGVLFDKDGTLLEFHSTQHHIYANVLACLGDRYRVPDPLLQQLKEALGLLPDRLTSDSLLQFSTNHQIAQALLETSRKHAAEHQWQLSLDEDDLMALIEELSLAGCGNSRRLVRPAQLRSLGLPTSDCPHLIE